MQYVRRRRELAGGTFEVTVHDVLVNDDYGLVVASGRGLGDSARNRAPVDEARSEV
jgi:hypothetical protein